MSRLQQSSIVVVTQNPDSYADIVTALPQASVRFDQREPWPLPESKWDVMILELWGDEDVDAAYFSSIRALPLKGRPLVLAVATEDRTPLLEAAMDAGCDTYAYLPIKAALILEMLSELLELRDSSK